MAFNWTPQQNMLLRMVSEFTDKEVAPFDMQINRDGRYPDGLFQKMVETGFLGIMLPREYGGTNYGAVRLHLHWRCGCLSQGFRQPFGRQVSVTIKKESLIVFAISGSFLFRMAERTSSVQPWCCMNQAAPRCGQAAFRRCGTAAHQSPDCS